METIDVSSVATNLRLRVPIFSADSQRSSVPVLKTLRANSATFAYVLRPVSPSSLQIAKLSKFRRYRWRLPSIVYTSTADARIWSTTSSNSWTSTHSQSPCWQPSHIKTSGTIIDWPRSGSNAKQMFFRRDTIGVSGERSNSHSPRQCSGNMDPTPSRSRRREKP